MNREKRSLKEKAQQALSRGEWRKALEFFQQHCAQKPEDLRSQRKVAELLERLNQTKEAIKVYRKLAEAYAEDGFLPQAISIYKIILRIDPSSSEINDCLEKIYAQKTKEMKFSPPLPHIPLLSDLNEQERTSLLLNAQTKTFPSETFICREGELGESLFILIRGKVAITKQSPKGKEIWIRNLREGDVLGEFGFFTDQRRHANVKALTECEVLEIHRDILNEMINNHPKIKEVLQTFFRQRVFDLFLACSPLFSMLPPEEREALFKRFQLQKVPEKTLLFRGGDPPEALYMIKKGEVEIFTQNRQGKKVILAVLGSGHFFGEIGILLNRPRMAFARTTQASELLRLDKADLEAWSLQSPQLRSAWKEISHQRLSEMNELLSQKQIEKTKEAMV